MNMFSYRGYWIEIGLEMLAGRHRWIVVVDGLLVADASNSGTAGRLGRGFVNLLPERQLANGLRFDLWRGV